VSGASALGLLRDVPGVLGSFTCGAFGELLSSDMPERFSRTSIETAAGRLGNLCHSSDEALAESRGVSICFADHQLHVRRYPGGLLCVLTDKSPHREQLEQVTNAVLACLKG
jgi:hypothetical protein